MATTNVQIVMTECSIRGISEPVNTYDGWKRLGMQVCKGEKALFTTVIWRPCKCKPKKDGEEGYTKLYTVKAAFFGLSQVKQAEDADLTEIEHVPSWTYVGL